MIRRLGMAYFAGAVGALIASLVLWVVGRAELLAMIGITLAPGLSWGWLSPRLLWGSLFGMGYGLVRRQGFTPVRSGLVLSLFPTFAELLVIMPANEHGFFGVNFGGLTFLVIVLTNGLWGWALSRIMISTGHS